MPEKQLKQIVKKANMEKNCCTRLRRRIGLFDKYVFSPLFIKDYERVYKKRWLSSQDEDEIEEDRQRWDSDVSMIQKKETSEISIIKKEETEAVKRENLDIQIEDEDDD